MVQYILDLRARNPRAHVDDIDHLGNRRLRTLDELAVEACCAQQLCLQLRPARPLKWGAVFPLQSRLRFMLF